MRISWQLGSGIAMRTDRLKTEDAMAIATRSYQT